MIAKTIALAALLVITIILVALGAIFSSLVLGGAGMAVGMLTLCGSMSLFIADNLPETI